MDLKATTYWRKTYSVEAIRITENNILEVAEACAGDYDDRPNAFAMDRSTPVPHIVLTRSMAFIGDWVVKVGDLWKVYTHEEFMRSFHTHDEEMANNSRYAKIFTLIGSAMAKQDRATFDQDQTGMDLILIETTKKVIGEL